MINVYPSLFITSLGPYLPTQVSNKVTDSPLFSSVRQLKMVNSSVLFRGFPEDYMLSEFVGDLDEELIAYRGSLTTPPCSPASWIVAKTVRKISVRDVSGIKLK